jgi:L-ribulose-5-phosphate 4-epimerase
MLEALKEEVLEANLQLPRRGLAILTWGNASGVDRERGLVVIKPSGVAYPSLTVEDLVVVELESGKRVEGRWRPSTDTATHLVLYRAFPSIGGVVHTHAPWTMAWAQAGRDLPVLGTTHADTFLGPVPCTRELTPQEVAKDYEAHTGQVLVECLKGKDPLDVPGALVRHHGAFAWGRGPQEAVDHAQALEIIAQAALATQLVAGGLPVVPLSLLDRHFQRKHGPGAYYGQDVRREEEHS